MPSQILCTFENEDLATVALSHLREHGVTLHSAQVHPNQFRQNQRDGYRINLPYLSDSAGVPTYFVMSNVIDNNTPPSAGSAGTPTYRYNGFEPGLRRDVKMSIIVDDADIAKADNILRSSSGYSLSSTAL